MKLTVHAYAKINWSLAICGERADGYHELDMLMQRIELSDELSFEPARWITLHSGGRYVPAGGNNLVLRAANALNDALGMHRGAHITLKKNIPSRAGLGGGSADCAAALLALDRLWNLRLPLRTLMRIGERLGADVPYCLNSGLCRVRGIGEIVEGCGASPVLHLAMVTPGGGLSTPAVFQAWNSGGYPMSQMDSEALAAALNAGDLELAQRLSRNDLEAPAIALMPQIGRIMEQFREMGARFVRMTGSGSTVFAVFDTEEAARSAAARIDGGIYTRTMG